MSLVDMYILGSWGDMLDLVNVVNKYVVNPYLVI
jgi:hypothetical protein